MTMTPTEAEEYLRYLDRENKEYLDHLAAKRARPKYEPETEDVGAGVVRTTFRPVPPDFFAKP